MTDLTAAHSALKAFKTLNDLDVLTPDQQREVYESIERKFGEQLPYGIKYPPKLDKNKLFDNDLIKYVKR